jgi:alpha-L-arabinofuranosidase
MNNKPVIGAEGQDGLYATACLDKDKGLIYIKVVNVTKEALSVPINLKEKKKKGGITDREVECIRFSCADPDAENTVDNPDKIKPERHKFTLNGNVLQARIAPESFCIYVIPAK